VFVKTNFSKEADEIVGLYIALVKKKLREEDTDSAVKLIQIANHLADLAELLVLADEVGPGTPKNPKI